MDEYQNLSLVRIRATGNIPEAKELYISNGIHYSIFNECIATLFQIF